MTFASILGQDAAVATLRRALASRRVHHAYRFEGPDGVGKEKTAFALAQALVCETRGDGTDACGTCPACKRAVTFSTTAPCVPAHPDVLVVERGLYPPAVLGRSREETQDISVDQIRRVVVAPLAYPPHEGRARIIIVRRADELSISAGNALLKTLEEPPALTHFVLITSNGRELLDTIRSRTLLLRFGALGDGPLRAILQKNGLSGPPLERALELGAGSASAALASADPDAFQDREAFVDAVLAALEADDFGGALALSAAKDRDKDLLRERLLAVAARLAARARRGEDDAGRAAERFEIVGTALLELERNASPALLLESMISRMRAATGYKAPGAEIPVYLRRV
jgi:DNA polymerase III subunit delta'